MSQKTAQKDPPKRRPIPGKPKDRMPPELLRPKNPPKKFMPMGGPKPMTPEMRKRLKEMGVIMRAPGGDVKSLKKAAGSVASILKAAKKNPDLVGVKGTNKKIMDLARKLKPTGRLSTTDLARAKRMLAGAFGKGKGQKPVFKTGTKEKVKGLTQKQTKKAQPLTAAQKKQLRKMMDNVSMRLPKATRPKKGPQGMIPLMGTAAKGMRKGFGSKNMKSAAKKMKRIM